MRLLTRDGKSTCSTLSRLKFSAQRAAEAAIYYKDLFTIDEIFCVTSIEFFRIDYVQQIIDYELAFITFINELKLSL